MNGPTVTALRGTSRHKRANAHVVAARAALLMESSRTPAPAPDAADHGDCSRHENSGVVLSTAG